MNCTRYTIEAEGVRYAVLFRDGATDGLGGGTMCFAYSRDEYATALRDLGEYDPRAPRPDAEYAKLRAMAPVSHRALAEECAILGLRLMDARGNGPVLTDAEFSTTWADGEGIWLKLNAAGANFPICPTAKNAAPSR